MNSLAVSAIIDWNESAYILPKLVFPLHIMHAVSTLAVHGPSLAIDPMRSARALDVARRCNWIAECPSVACMSFLWREAVIGYSPSMGL